jgi:hypothetical protein
MKALNKTVRLLVVPFIWLAFVPYAIAAGHNPGFVFPDPARPYPTGHVVAVCVLMAIESVVLFAMLRPTSYQLRDWRRALKVLGVLALAFFLEPMYTDMPGYVYVNSAFLFAWGVFALCLVLLGSVLAQLLALRTRSSSRHAA